MWTYCRYFWFDPPLSFQLQSQELKAEDISFIFIVLVENCYIFYLLLLCRYILSIIYFRVQV